MPPDETQALIREFVLRQFPLAKKRQIQDNEHLLENGIVDSLGVLDVVTFLEEKFHIKVLDEDLVPENFKDIETLTRFVRQRSSAAEG